MASVRPIINFHECVFVLPAVGVNHLIGQYYLKGASLEKKNLHILCNPIKSDGKEEEEQVMPSG